MARKLPLTLVQRARAFAFLRQGMHPDDIAARLQARHKTLTLDEVKRAYFPLTGNWAIWKKMLKIREVEPERLRTAVSEAWKKAAQTSRNHSEMSAGIMARLNQDSNFSEKRTQALADVDWKAVRKRQFENPDFSRMHSERMSRLLSELRKDEAFLEKRLGGIKNRAARRKQEKTRLRENLYGQTLKIALESAMETLDESDRAAIERWLAEPSKRIGTIAKAALDKLRNHPAMIVMYENRKPVED